MHVLMLTWEYPPRMVGGLARHVAELSEQLAQAGHEVTVVTAGDGRLPAREVDKGVVVLRTPSGHPSPPDFLSSVLQLNLNLVETVWQSGLAHTVQVVHAHDWLVAHAAKALKHSLCRPLIATIHATEHGRNHGIHNDLQRYISNVEWWLTYEAWRVIVCSEAMKAELRGIFQLPMDKITVIPNGVVPERCRDRLPEDLAEFRRRYAAPDEKIVFFMGRLVPEKGVGVLLQAIPEVLAYHAQTKFVISGGGPQEAELKARARDLGIFDRIYFTGFIDDQTRNGLLAIADVATFPSTYEPFGIVALEAMAAGVPVVVGDTGGLGEIVDHGRNGLKAIPGNPVSLAHQILAVLSSAELRGRLVRQASMDVQTRFRWANIAQRVNNLYQAVWAEYQASEWARQASAEAGAGIAAARSAAGLKPLPLATDGTLGSLGRYTSTGTHVTVSDSSAG
ncbi:MAG: glycosyltransferase family 4 protein [Limnochordaceae bacterium]|nr:glycosyltransferase family 4 protein [Limnochordaceae bacterium]